MPGSTDVYGTRDEVCVKVAAIFGGLLYVFDTNTSESEKSILGQIPAKVNGVYRPGAVKGINAPKPAVYETISAATGHDSSFGDYQQHDNLLAAGWKQIEPVYTRTANDTPFAAAYYVDWQIGTNVDDPESPVAITVRYAFSKPDFNAEAIGAELESVLGVTLITDREDRAFVWGSDSGKGRRFKPKRASKSFTNANGTTSRKSSFVATNRQDTAIGAGWSISDR